MFDLREANDQGERLARVRAFLLYLPLWAATLVTACRSAIPQEDPASRPHPEPVRVVTYNVRHGHGMDGAVELERVAAALRALEPDIVLLQEVDQGCARSGSVDQAMRLGAMLNMASAFGPFRPYDGGLYGMAALTRFPILNRTVVPLPPGPNPLSSLELRIDTAFGPCIVAGLHLVQTQEQRLAQANFLVERYAEADEPVILAGDLNSERDSAVLASLARLFLVPEKPADPNTFPSDDPVKEIDFVLLSRDSPWQIVRSFVDHEAMASDHRPVALDVWLSAEKLAAPRGPQ